MAKQTKSPIVINLYAGPGAGKSTTAAGVFFELKSRGLNCELITEYAKSKVWEESFHILDNQLYVFAKQYHKQFIVADKVDAIITDAPLLLSLIYGEHMPNSFKQLVKDTYNTFENLDYYIVRKKVYNPMGRLQTEDDAKKIDEITLKMLQNNEIPFEYINGDKEAPSKIADKVMELLNK